MKYFGFIDVFSSCTSKTQCAVAKIVDQFGRKRCQKKRKDVIYKLY